MNWVFLIIPVVVFGADNSTLSAGEICLEYAECIERAQLKSNECAAAATSVELHGKRTTCTEAKSVHDELQALYAEATNDLVSCIKSNSSNAQPLIGGKAHKCSVTASKLSKKSALEPTRREKRKERKDKKDKNGNGKNCVKDARRMRSHCAKVAKCCNIIKKCNLENPKDSIAEKRKELKDTVKKCVMVEQKERRAKKKDKESKKKSSIPEAEKIILKPKNKKNNEKAAQTVKP